MFKIKYNTIILSLIFCFMIQNVVFAKNGDKIVIDPGHGGIDFGTTLYGIIEKDINLDIAKNLKANLISKGFNVILTRESDTSLYLKSFIGNTLERRDLNVRTNIINNSGAKYFISIHVNSEIRYPKANGSIVFFNSQMSKSKTLANDIQKSINGIKLKNINRTKPSSREADFYLFRNTKVPGVLIETAFASNKQDRELLRQQQFRKQIATAIAVMIN